ncbi:hypothetical protein PI124_g2447 [Phytophthora idaei]|nr:hypothetical protein PI126_g3143 [Phytophthora idaei]KAG3253014.1 hypothetical protein PI124_g2447 [Phytophthora idaei]
MQSDGHKKGERVHESSSPSLSGAAFPVKCTIVVHVTNTHSAAEKTFGLPVVEQKVGPHCRTLNPVTLYCFAVLKY